jgi:hypothetical protein
MTTKTTRTKKSAKKTKKGSKKKMDMKSLKEMKENYEKALRAQGQQIMRGAIEEFFMLNPKVTGVAWTQYTPYFNDGEECVFGVNDPYFNFGEFDLSDVPNYGDDLESGWGNHHSFNLYDLKEPDLAGEDWAIEHNATVNALFDEQGLTAADVRKVEESFRTTVGVAPEDLFLAAFGDHVKVVLTRDSIEVEQYDHE